MKTQQGYVIKTVKCNGRWKGHVMDTMGISYASTPPGRTRQQCRNLAKDLIERLVEEGGNNYLAMRNRCRRNK